MLTYLLCIYAGDGHCSYIICVAIALGLTTGVVATLPQGCEGGSTKEGEVGGC